MNSRLMFDIIICIMAILLVFMVVIAIKILIKIKSYQMNISQKYLLLALCSTEFFVGLLAIISMFIKYLLQDEYVYRLFLKFEQVPL